MNTYNEFKINPWNFIKKKLKITIEEKLLEDQIKLGQSDLNYRNFLLYQNNGLKPTFLKLDYEKLISVSSILTIFYVFDLDTYIIEIPNKLCFSCISTLIIINPSYSESFKIDLDNYSYGSLDLYYLISKDFKIVYDSIKSNIYLEGNENSKYYFFRNLKYYQSKASIRIYSVNKIINSKKIWKNDQFLPNNNKFINNQIPLYQNLTLRNRSIDNKSNGLNYFINYIKSKPEESALMLMKRPIYKTGILQKDFNKLRNIIINGKNEIGISIGKLINKDFKVEDKLYKDRLNNYGYIAILEDCFIGLFFNSNSKSPFINNNSNKRESIFIFMNQYCYFIGKTKSEFNYSFNENRILFNEHYDQILTEIKTSYLKLRIDNTYKIRGDFKVICNLPLITNDKSVGRYVDYYLIDTIPSLNLVEKY